MDSDKWMSEYLLPKRIIQQFEDFNASQDQSPPAITKLLTQFAIEWFPRYFGKTYGVKIEFDEDKRKEFEEYLKGFINKFLEAAERASELPEGSECEALETIGKPILELMTQDPKYRDRKYSSLFDFYDDFYKEVLFSDYGGSYLSKTNAVSYRKAVYKLIDEVILVNGGLPLLTSIIDSQELASDMFFVQKKWFGLLKHIGYLNGEFRRFKEPTVYKLIDIFYELFELYAKFLPAIRTLLEFVEGNSSIKLQDRYGDNVANHIGKIKGNRDYTVLADVDKIMRNAGSHDTYLFDREQGSVIFKDRKDTLILRPKELLTKTRELSALVLSLSGFLNYVQYKRLSLLHDYCAQKTNSTAKRKTDELK